MQLFIDNSSYAKSDIVFGRILPALVTICAVWSLGSLLVAGITGGTAIPVLLTVLWIVVMIIVYVRRGYHPAVKSIEFVQNRINVQFFSGESSFEINEIRKMEYEGVHNRTRVEVLHAPFPNDGQRILVITLSDGSELRLRVSYEHDAPLKELAAQS